MLFLELNHGKCKTYLVACETTHKAALIDPIRERLDRYLAFLAYRGLKLDAVIDTHTHADHRTASFELGNLTGAKVIMHRSAPAPRVDIHMEDGQKIIVGTLELTLFLSAWPRLEPNELAGYLAVALASLVAASSAILDRRSTCRVF